MPNLSYMLKVYVKYFIIDIHQSYFDFSSVSQMLWFGHSCFICRSFLGGLVVSVCGQGTLPVGLAPGLELPQLLVLGHPLVGREGCSQPKVSLEFLDSCLIAIVILVVYVLVSSCVIRYLLDLGESMAKCKPQLFKSLPHHARRQVTMPAKTSLNPAPPSGIPANKCPECQLPGRMSMFGI